MNRENITILRDTFIRLNKAPLPEYPDKGFNMMEAVFKDVKRMQGYTQHDCGTAACILGWRRILGITIGLPFSAGLYTPEDIKLPGGDLVNYYQDPQFFTLEAAITTLSHLLDTGEVDWEYGIANPYTPEVA